MLRAREEEHTGGSVECDWDTAGWVVREQDEEGRAMQGTAGQAKDSGLFSELGLKQNTECPGRQTKFHPE